MSYLNLPNRASYCYGRELSGDIHSTAKVQSTLGTLVYSVYSGPPTDHHQNIQRTLAVVHTPASCRIGSWHEAGEWFPGQGPELYSGRDFNNGPSTECRNPISCPCMQMMVILLREFPDCVVEFMLIMLGWYMFVMNMTKLCAVESRVSKLVLTCVYISTAVSRPYVIARDD